MYRSVDNPAKNILWDSFWDSFWNSTMGLEHLK